MIKPAQLKKVLRDIRSIEFVPRAIKEEWKELCPACFSEKPNHVANCKLNDAIQILKQEIRNEA